MKLCLVFECLFHSRSSHQYHFQYLRWLKSLICSLLAESRVVTVAHSFCVKRLGADLTVWEFFPWCISQLQWPLWGTLAFFMVNWSTSSDMFFSPSDCSLVKKNSWAQGRKPRCLFKTPLRCRSRLERGGEGESIEVRPMVGWQTAADCVARQEVWHGEHRKWLLWSYAKPFVHQLQGLGSIHFQLHWSCSSFSGNKAQGKLCVHVMCGISENLKDGQRTSL